MTSIVRRTTDRHQLYWAGYMHGNALARHEPFVNHEPRLKLEVDLLGNQRHRAWALGELRGYRQATGRPEPLYGHQAAS